jgi:hypothetical protein
LFFIGRCHNFWGIIFGFLGFVSSRVWFVSFVPTWWDGFTNSIVITVGVISTVQHIIEGMYKAETVLKLCYFNSLIIFYHVGTKETNHTLLLTNPKNPKIIPQKL